MCKPFQGDTISGAHLEPSQTTRSFFLRSQCSYGKAGCLRPIRFIPEFHFTWTQPKRIKGLSISSSLSFVEDLRAYWKPYHRDFIPGTCIGHPFVVKGIHYQRGSFFLFSYQQEGPYIKWDGTFFAKGLTWLGLQLGLSKPGLRSDDIAH